MKKRINLQLIAIAAVAIISTMIMVSAAFYELFCDQIFQDLTTYSYLLENGNISEDYKDASLEDWGIRVTLIQPDGQVIFDSEADQESMTNHAGRPEITSALETGKGTDIRTSETIGQSTFYYAREMEDGNILRVAKLGDSLLSVFGNAVPLIGFIFGVLLLLCWVLTRFLTKNLLKPIEYMANNLDHVEEIETYDEIQPFLETIHKQHDDILKAAQMRQEFTANVSHELKTPLTAISGYAELIETGMACEEDVNRFAQGIHKSANRLLTLINDIIKLSEIDGNTTDEDWEQVNLYQSAKVCVEMLQVSAEKHQVSISLMGEDCYVQGNKQMLEELLYNLCDNAIRYNNIGGSVDVRIWQKDGRAVLEVEDTGIGIPKESQERVFERFYRVDKSRSKSTGGTGLGLAIVKHIIAKHEATMELSSQVGEGTKITVNF
ncbi:MAG: two-component sensor histidine kinase [Lachnospiraceae bacterium]|nr:two-component sensor histidine kinase [Lachnospiraceae bacterium]